MNLYEVKEVLEDLKKAEEDNDYILQVKLIKAYYDMTSEYMKRVINEEVQNKIKIEY